MRAGTCAACRTHPARPRHPLQRLQDLPAALTAMGARMKPSKERRCAV